MHPDVRRKSDLNRAAVGAYSHDGTRLVCTTINPRRICLIAGLRQGFDAPGNPSRTERPTNPTRVHTGIVGRTSTNERWQAEDCGRQMTGTAPRWGHSLTLRLRRRDHLARIRCQSIASGSLGLLSKIIGRSAPERGPRRAPSLDYSKPRRRSGGVSVSGERPIRRRRSHTELQIGAPEAFPRLGLQAIGVP